MHSPTFNLTMGSPDERLDEFERFFEHWLGARKDDYGVAQDMLKTLALPKPLSRFYAFLGNWPGSPMCTQNVFHPVETLASQKAVAIGLIEFAVENQGVLRWATIVEGNDPPVYCADHWNDLPEGTPLGDFPAPGWEDWDFSLTDFLISYAITELALGAKPGVAIPWSSSLENYVKRPEAEVVVLRRSTTGEPVSILVDGSYLLDGREHDRWKFCAARSDDTAAALKRFDGDLDSLLFDYGPLKSKKRYRRSWFVEVWATGAARVRHHTLDEWLPPGTVDVDALMILLQYGKAPPDICVEATVKKLGESGTKAWLPVNNAISLFDSIIEAIPPRNPGLLPGHERYHARAYAAKYPPVALRREPADITATADFVSQPALTPVSTVPGPHLLNQLNPPWKTATESDEIYSIVVQLDQWKLSIRADGSGVISWKLLGAAFDAGSINVTESAAQLRSSSITVEQKAIDVQFLMDTLQSHLEIKPELSFRRNLEYLEEFGERAVRHTIKAAVCINDATPSTHAVEPDVVEALWNRAVNAIGKLPITLQTAANAMPPDFVEAANFRQSFRVEHPDILEAQDGEKP